LGPSCWDIPSIKDMLDDGVNVACVNMAEAPNGFEDFEGCCERLRDVLKEKAEYNCAIMVETKGPTLHLGKVQNDRVELLQGQMLELTTDELVLGTNEIVSCDYPQLADNVKEGGKIIINMGQIEMKVTQKYSKSVQVKVMNSGIMRSNMRMHLPGCIVDRPTLTAKDIDDIENFAVPQNVDLVSCSFVRTADDIQNVRKYLGDECRHIKVIAKIENRQAVDNFDTILDEADGIIISRTTLGLEIPQSHLFLAQKMMIKKATISGTPLWVEVFMTDSTVTPPRAEIADIANAVIEGADCILLTNEIEDPFYRSKTIQHICSTAKSAEGVLDPEFAFRAIRDGYLEKHGKMSIQESLSSSAVKCALELPAAAIIVVTDDYQYARQVAKYRPQCPIIAVTANDWAHRQINGSLRGCTATLVESLEGSEAIVLEGVEFGKRKKWINEGDPIVCLRNDSMSMEIFRG
jgi:pyruvate kinase